MLLLITLSFFCVFIFFQVLYTFIPLYTIKKRESVYLSTEKGFSVLVPAYNEKLVIENCLRGILEVNYKEVEFIFINDGSTDETLNTLAQHLSLVKMPKQKLGVTHYQKVKAIYQSTIYPEIWVIDKENGGKADALNTGIDFAKNEIIITLDADSILEVNALNEMNKTFMDNSVVAAGGLVNVVQGFNHNGKDLAPCFRIPGLIRFQVVRYLTGFYMNKTTQSKLGALTVIAGAFGAFRKSVLIQTKGYRKTVGEDMDITLRIQELIGTVLKGKRIVFVPEAICYTECPPSLKSLYKQRIRWQKAFIDCILTYRNAYFRKMNVKVSLFLLVDSLILGTFSAYSVLMIPIILLLTLSHIKLLLFLFTISFSLAIILNIATLIVSSRFGHAYNFKNLFSIILFLPIEVLVFRMTEVIFVTFGTILYFFNKDGWSRSDRVGKPISFNNKIKLEPRSNVGGS